MDSASNDTVEDAATLRRARGWCVLATPRLAGPLLLFLAPAIMMLVYFFKSTLERPERLDYGSTTNVIERLALYGKLLRPEESRNLNQFRGQLPAKLSFDGPPLDPEIYEAELKYYDEILSIELDVRLCGFYDQVNDGSIQISGNPHAVAVLRDSFIQSATEHYGEGATLIYRKAQSSGWPLIRWGDEAEIMCNESSIHIRFGEIGKHGTAETGEIMQNVYGKMDWLGKDLWRKGNKESRGVNAGSVPQR